MIPLRNLKRFFRKAIKQPRYAFRVAVKRLKAGILYYIGNNISSPPEAITLFLTHRCNLRCKMCGQWGESGATKKMPKDAVGEELSLDGLRNLIDNVSKFRPNITLFGGEPLLYSGCVDLIRHIKAKGMHCLMITNGYLLSEFAEDLVEAGLDELNVSLDAGQSLHDEIRGMQGLFDKITTGLKRINQIKKEKGFKKPLINLQCTITKYNYNHLRELIDVGNQVGIDSLTYHNLIFLGKDLIDKQKKYDKVLGCSSVDWEGFVFSPQIDPDNLFLKIQEIKSSSHPFNVDFYPNLSLKGLKEYYNNPSYLPSEYKPRCLSAWIVAYIFPDGEIRPCLNCTYSFGNIKNSRFLQIWNSKKAIDFRRILRENKIFPVCARCTELYRY